MRTILRQGASYFVIGLLQIAIDWAVFVSSTWLGLPAAPSNVTGRIIGAGFGFWANGRLTFASENTRLGRKHFIRFSILWIMTTVASTLVMAWIASSIDLGAAWKAKPVVDLILSGISFLASKHWVYRH